MKLCTENDEKKTKQNNVKTRNAFTYRAIKFKTIKLLSGLIETRLSHFPFIIR